MIIPINNAMAFSYIDNMKNGNYIFFLTDLDTDVNIELNVTHTGSGDFNLFLFNTRPLQSYVNDDNSLNVNILSDSITYSLDDNPYLNFTASEEKIYYIEIILVSDGPDTFYLTSTISYNNGTVIDKDLIQYYLPIIPSFPIEYLVTSIIIAIGSIIVIYKKKIGK
jgi:hypothetical protein